MSVGTRPSSAFSRASARHRDRRAGGFAGPIGSVADVVGTLWINAILMTILPLVVSKLIVSIAGHEDGDAGAGGLAAGIWYVSCSRRRRPWRRGHAAVFTRLRLSRRRRRRCGQRTAAGSGGRPARSG